MSGCWFSALGTAFFVLLGRLFAVFTLPQQPKFATVERSRNQVPLAANLLDAAKVEAPEAEHMFYIADYRFDRRLPFVQQASSRLAACKLSATITCSREFSARLAAVPGS